MHVKALGAAVRASLNMALLMLAVGLLTAGCNSSPDEKDDPSIPVSQGNEPSVYATVDCATGTDAWVQTRFGSTEARSFIGPNSEFVTGTFQSAYSNTFKLASEPKRLLTITVEPKSGICKTTLKERSSGDVLASKDTSEDVTLRVLLRRTG